MKRVFDVVCALFGLIALSPLLALAALGVFLEDRRSPFFFGIRVAQGGGDFRMIKFRTMVPHAWKSGVNSTSSSDRRITRTGSLLRRVKLDEFPQLWNVLTGDMSLVGPRPQVRTDAGLYTAEENRLLSARPGITDLASIVFADEGEILAGSENPDLLYNQIIRPWKSRLALLYLDHATFATDVRLILLTLASAMDRDLALRGVQSILSDWGADAARLSVTRRTRPLPAAPPPGAAEIVSAYPQRAASA
jgi:lipopolysaccharide/colanic/teichoic acid biosynthesis glycosyltransferase